MKTINENYRIQLNTARYMRKQEAFEMLQTQSRSPKLRNLQEARRRKKSTKSKSMDIGKQLTAIISAEKIWSRLKSPSPQQLSANTVKTSLHTEGDCFLPERKLLKFKFSQTGSSIRIDTRETETSQIAMEKARILHETLHRDISEEKRGLLNFVKKAPSTIRIKASCSLSKKNRLSLQSTPKQTKIKQLGMDLIKPEPKTIAKYNDLGIEKALLFTGKTPCKSSIFVASMKSKCMSPPPEKISFQQPNKGYLEMAKRLCKSISLNEQLKKGVDSNNSEVSHCHISNQININLVYGSSKYPN